MNTTQSPSAEKQLAYIRWLAQKTGQPVRTPRTRRAASWEIEELLVLKDAQDEENAEALAS